MVNISSSFLLAATFISSSHQFLSIFFSFISAPSCSSIFIFFSFLFCFPFPCLPFRFLLASLLSFFSCFLSLNCRAGGGERVMRRGELSCRRRFGTVRPGCGRSRLGFVAARRGGHGESEQRSWVRRRLGGAKKRRGLCAAVDRRR